MAEAKLAPGTEKLLENTAEHLSKMQGGASVGGFPGFEPPEDDEKYRRKIKNRAYTPEEAEHWIKELNNFLKQVAEKNPGMTLEEILQKQGLSLDEIDNFIVALRNAHATAAGMEGYGVNVETVQTMESLFQTLGVSTW